MIPEPGSPCRRGSRPRGSTPPGDRPDLVVGARYRRTRATAVLGAVIMLALVLVLSGRAGAAGNGAAGKGTTSTRARSGGVALSLLSQTPWVNPARSTFDLRLRAGPTAPAPDHLGVSVAVYSCLSSVSSFDQSLSPSGPPGTPIARTGSPLPWTALRSVHGGVDLPLLVNATNFSATEITPTRLVIDLRAGGPDCGAGVYPVRLELVNTGTGATIGSLTTSLIYVAQAAPNQRLEVATVLPLSTAVHPAAHPSASQLLADPYRALDRPSKTALAAIGKTANAIEISGVPVTVTVGGRTVQVLADFGQQSTVLTLAQLSANGRDQFVSSPYVPVNAAALVDSGLGAELTAQVSRGAQVLDKALIQRVPAQATGGGTGPWLTSQALDGPTLTQLSAAGYRQLVLPPSDLTSSPAIGSSAEPFVLRPTHGAPFTAIASNPDIAARFSSNPGDPVLAASQILAEMAQIYFEYPNGIQPRAIVAMPLPGWNTDPTLITTLLSALSSSQILRPVTLGTAISSFTPVHCDGSCGLSSAPTANRLPVAAIRAQRGRIAGLVSAIVAGTARGRVLPSELGDLVLASEAESLNPGQQRDVLANTGAAIDAELGQITLSGDLTLTLAARKGQIPITIDKQPTAPFGVTGTLTLSSDRLLFANGLSRISLPETLLHPTNNIYVNVEARTSGEFKMQISFQAPSNGLVLTSGTVTVRSDAYSIVGVFLSLGAVIVLGAWWVRTGLRRRRQRRIDAAADPT